MPCMQAGFNKRSVPASELVAAHAEVAASILQIATLRWSPLISAQAWPGELDQSRCEVRAASREVPPRREERSSAQSCSANIHAYLLRGSERVRLLAGEAEGEMTI